MFLLNRFILIFVEMGWFSEMVVVYVRVGLLFGILLNVKKFG